MRKKVELLQGTKIVMVHENETDIYGYSAGHCVDLATSINSEHFKLAYDPANFVSGQKISRNVDVCWPLMKPFVAHVHVKDWKMSESEAGSIPGEGDGQIEELFVELAKTHYEGFLTIEPHLKSGGKFGGDTGPELFAQAIRATRALCTKAGLVPAEEMSMKRKGSLR